MKKFFAKPYRWAIICSLLLTAAFTFVLLDTFVIPKTLTAVAGTTKFAVDAVEATKTTTQTDIKNSIQTQGKAAITDNSYEDENIKIKIETYRKYNTTIYMADVQLTDASLLKTALADDTYGRNIKETTSAIAESHQAILAVNGDYYGFRDSGYVLRNGKLYRDTVNREGTREDLVIDKEGDFSIISESESSIKSLNIKDIWHILSFGPALVENGQITVDSSSEVSKSMSSNPRTAIGQISSLHYIILVSDGRTSEDKGLSLLDLAQELKDKGCTTAYNLDGGGSSTMVFNGKIINEPTDGKKSGEREVSDIVYIGY